MAAISAFRSRFFVNFSKAISKAKNLQKELHSSRAAKNKNLKKIDLGIILFIIR